MLAVKARDLTFKWKNSTNKELITLNNVNFSIFPGDFLGIIGENGSGKSTLLKMISGLLKPSCGEVLINNINVFKYLKEKRENRFNIGVVFQNPEEQLFGKTLYEDIAFALKNMSLSPNEIKNRVLDAIRFVNLSEEKLIFPLNKISGGEKRKAAIAGIIAMLPKILLLDEPTAGLDNISSKVILENIKKYNKESKATVILVTHNLEDILKYANKILILNNGTLSAFCETKDIFLDKNFKFIYPYLAEPSKVLVSLKNKGYNICNLNKEIFKDTDDIVNIIFGLLEKNSLI